MTTKTHMAWGRGEAPPQPTPARIVIDPHWTPRQLSIAMIRANGARLAVASTLLMLFGMSNMLMPTVVGRIIDDVATPAFDGESFTNLSQPLYFWFGALVILFAIIHLSFRIGSRTGWLAVQRSQYEMSQAVITRVLSPRGFAGPRRAPGQLLAVATGDTQRASQVFYILVYPPGQVVALLVAAITLITINLWLGIGVIIGLPLVLALLHLAAKPLRARSMKEQQSLADATGAAADLISGFRVISGLHAQKTAARTYQGISQEALHATLSARNAAAAFSGVTTAGAQLTGVIVALVAIVMAFEQVITAGELITATGIAVIMISPIEELVGTLGSMWAMSQASCQRVLDLLGAHSHPATAETVDIDDDAHFIAFEELSLSGQVIDARIEPDEFVVMNIPQASASELVDILSLKHVAETGTFVVGGFDITAITPASLHRQLMVLPRHPGLFAGSVMDNVQLNGTTVVDEGQAYASLNVAAFSAHELPDAFETELGDGAWSLSGGQRQRISLARAIAANPRILILVEPTTSVDAVTEERIARRLKAHREGLLTVVISGSGAFASVADRTIYPREESPS